MINKIEPNNDTNLIQGESQSNLAKSGKNDFRWLWMAKAGKMNKGDESDKAGEGDERDKSEKLIKASEGDELNKC